MKPYKELLSLLRQMEKIGDSLALTLLTLLHLIVQSIILLCAIGATVFIVGRRLVLGWAKEVAYKKTMRVELFPSGEEKNG